MTLFTENNMTIMKSDKSTVIASLTNLNIRSNMLSNITVDHLASFPNVNNLRMNNNQFKSFDANLFSKSR